MTDDERIAYLAGGHDTALDAEDRAGLDDLRGLLADPACWVEPSGQLEGDVVAAIAAAGRLATQPEPKPTQLRSRVVPRSRRAWLAAGVASLVAAAAVAIGLAAGLGGTITHPVRYTVALSGTALAPDAKGNATMTQTVGGWRVALHATGLPRLANGRFYEAWLKNPGGVLVPIGTFNQPTDITLWSGVPPTTFPTLTVTRQEANGLEVSSGQRVLVGTAHPAR